MHPSKATTTKLLCRTENWSHRFKSRSLKISNKMMEYFLNSKPDVQTQKFEKWTITTSKSHIMTKAERDKYESEMTLPHLPDMVFTQNSLKIDHSDGFGLRFEPLEPLRFVNDHDDLIHVAMAGEWVAARESMPHALRIVHPFDWTFTPEGYKGSIWSDTEEPKIRIEPTDQKINYEKLKEKERILFFDDVLLYEDELDDNGCSKLSVKIRVMPSGFFCLLRFYLRVDHTMVRIYDTRFYHEAGTNFILREFSKRENKVSELKVPMTVWRDQNEISNHLSVLEEVTEKLIFCD